MAKTNRSHMLVIDDNEDVRWMSAESGMQTAANARAGITAIEGGGLVLVFCDIEGIRADGVQAEDVIAVCLAANLPVVCISGNPCKATALAQRFGIEAIGKFEVDDYIERLASGGA